MNRQYFISTCQPLLALLVSLLIAAPTLAQPSCPSSISSTTPDSRYQDHGDDTVTDLQTGLMWQKCSLGKNGPKCETGSLTAFTWNQALQQGEDQNSSGGFAGYSDWRLPNVNELESLVEEACYNPAINVALFPSTPGLTYWSSSPYANGLSSAWGVDFDGGYSYNDNRGYVRYVRLVRSGQDGTPTIPPEAYSASVHTVFDMGTLTSVANVYSNQTTFSKNNLRGIRPTVFIDSSEFDQVTKDDVALYPPNEILYMSNFEGAFDSIASPSIPLPANYKSDGSNFYEFHYINSVPDGDWLLKIAGDDQVKATFTFTDAYPYDGLDRVNVPIPSIKLVMTGEMIFSIEVQWYIYSGGEFVALTEDQMNTIAGLNVSKIELSDWNSGLVEHDDAISPAWNGIYEFLKSGELVIGSGGINTVRMLGLGYAIGNVEYSFMFDELGFL